MEELRKPASTGMEIAPEIRERIDKCLAQARSENDCLVLPAGLAPFVLDTRCDLPTDVKYFYSKCGGMYLFMNERFGFRIVAPLEIVRSDPVALGLPAYRQYQTTLDNSNSAMWYVIAVGNRLNLVISIDLCRERLGLCYDSYPDYHGTNEAAVVATSFVDLIERMLRAKGNDLWYDRGKANLGFAKVT